MSRRLSALQTRYAWQCDSSVDLVSNTNRRWHTKDQLSKKPFELTPYFENPKDTTTKSWETHIQDRILSSCKFSLWSARDICLWAKNSIWHSLPPKGVLNHCNYWITTLFPIYLVYRVYSWHSSECWCLMLKTSGGRSLVVGCGVVGITAAVVAISLLRRVSAIAKFDKLTSTVCTKNFTHARL